MRRRMMYTKPLIEVIEELTTVGKGIWIVPPGCTSVDVFMVGGGSHGGIASGGTPYRNSGPGGRGGFIRTIINLRVRPNDAIDYFVSSAAMSNTSFLGNSVNIDGTYIPGGGSANAVDENTDGSGGNGKDGLYPFNDPSFGKRYGASGGGGAAKAGKSGGFGGFTGGGKGGDSTKNRNGSDATFFGGGGGGGGLMYEYLPIGEGGKGYQGIIILRYKKYK